MSLAIRTSLIALSSVMMLSACSTVSSLWSDQTETENVKAQTTTSMDSKHGNASSNGSDVASASGSIDLVWSNNVDQRKPASPMGFSVPTAVQSSAGERIIVGGQDYRVRIYNAQGSELNRIALNEACESAALQMSNGLVIVGDLGGTIYALDIDQAKVIWSVGLSAALIGSPIAYGDGFIIQTSNNQLYRFSHDGKKIWSYSDALGGLSMHLSPSPVVYKGRVFAALSNGDVVALNADTGSFIWKRQLLLSNKASVMSELKVPVAMPLLITAKQSGRDEDVLLVPVFQGQLSFLSLLDGSTLSNRKISSKSSPLLVGDQVFVADTSGALSALNALDGETTWKQQLSDGELTGPVLWQGSLWVADDQATVYRLSQSGKLLASKDLDGRIDRSPVVGKNGILVRNNLGSIYMLR
ncbi:pyrrolo-quinoline quinone [Mariprofundus sp. EBB-1]|uniref:outer membrane protein assembly factor BamB family protein n=1 Tax=Mariprofundus sp. EBB-1 TaxID=2650971 RepID=UPI000EF1C50B|nr:PQQ-binding-like beta-propeller repeat protein [Mariprofundus sp. EBB-1]RLL55923.1 pyrrolo-quinoline quinone [Mariprofundus sp. EBB-1]